MFLYSVWLLAACIFLSIPCVWQQQQHWASLCAELSCAWGPSLPSFLLVGTHTQCCHSSHLWINKLLSLQVCSGAGKCGGKGYSVPPPQVSVLALWTMGGRSGDMNSLLSLVKYLSVSLLLGILEFIGCCKGCWLILKAVFDRHYWVLEANRHNKMFSRHLND